MLDQSKFSPVARSLISSKPQVSGIASLRQVDGFGTINLRLTDDVARKYAENLLQCDVPVAANRFATSGTISVLWFGPNEWMVQVPEGEITALHQSLETALAGKRFAATIVSDHSVAMELSGAGARHVLEKGCPLDLHTRAFGEGSCAQSHFLQAVIIVAATGPDRYLLRVRRSMAEYLWDALADAIGKGM